MVMDQCGNKAFPTPAVKGVNFPFLRGDFHPMCVQRVSFTDNAGLLITCGFNSSFVF